MIRVELLYLDLDACGRCQGADANLDAALGAVEKVLALAGHDVSVAKIHVTSEDQALELGFASSPTIRVDGRDIALVSDSPCGACGDLAGTEVGCRTWTWKGKEYTEPPVGMIADAILRGVYSCQGPAEPAAFEGSEVQRFLKAKAG